MLPHILSVDFHVHKRINGVTPQFGMLYAPWIFVKLTLLFELIERHFTKVIQKESGKKAQEYLEGRNTIQTASVILFVDVMIMLAYYFYTIIRVCMNVEQVDYSAKLSILILSAMLLCASIGMILSPKNRWYGLRTKYSMHNDITWKKSNRFAGVVGIILMVLMILLVSFVQQWTLIVLLLGFLIIWSVAGYAASKYFYCQQCKKE